MGWTPEGVGPGWLPNFTGDNRTYRTDEGCNRTDEEGFTVTDRGGGD